MRGPPPRLKPTPSPTPLFQPPVEPPTPTETASVEVHGKLVESKGGGQKWEVVAEKFTVLGEADATYPLQKKGHTMEFLREIAHLRPRSNLFGAVFRVRSRLAYAVHQFFQERHFNYVHTPIITASDAEGAGLAVITQEFALIEELSVAPVQLPSVKYAIRKLDAAHCHAMVEDCLRHGETERIAQRVHDTAMRFYSELLA